MITLIILAVVSLMVLIIGGVFILVFGLPILDVAIAIGTLWIIFRGIPKMFKAIGNKIAKKKDSEVIEGSFKEKN